MRIVVPHDRSESALELLLRAPSVCNVIELGAVSRKPEGDVLGRPAAVPRDSWRTRVRAKPGVRHVYRAGVFVVGLLFVALGVALAALPGPLTIPPVLFGLWIWSTEFRWAQKLFQSFRRKGEAAWAHAKAHPVSSAAITIGGIAAAIAAFWAVNHFDLIAKARDAVGI